MQKVLGGRIWIAVIVVLMVTVFGWMIVQMYPYFFRPMTTIDTSYIIDGEYSVDGGEWRKTDPSERIDHFHHIVFRGKPVEDAAVYSKLTIYSKDVWYQFRLGDYDLMNYTSFVPDPEIQDLSPKEKIPETPGYWVATFDFDNLLPEEINGDIPFTLEIDYPYERSADFSDCVFFTLGMEESYYLKFFFDVFPWVILFLLICFFGIFFFPVSGFILGKINFKYLTFGVMCFFWGLYMIIQKSSWHLNLWITDPTLCMMADRMTSYLLITSILIYFKSNMERKATRIIGNITVGLFFAMIVTALMLQVFAVTDLTASEPYVFVGIALFTIVMIVLLCIETRGNRNAFVFLISWSPLMLALALDIIDQYSRFAVSRFFNYGLAITMVYQMVHLVLDLRKQYKEAIRYQQMQKELYEAKVSVMVSQIQPHFMYNALTSIAMMCQIDPDTAQEATITFAKYLRGNMDSLKQTKPVPFEQELEHLKKYLYIEKLRFGKKLNIEYDIQAENFVLPQLSIQPLVENAVKHGVGMKKKGGTVTISTRETDTAYEVIISDDGVGFDTAAEKKDDGRSHVGMENILRRVKDMCGGEIRIESTVGEGTKATVILPKEGQPNENTVS